MDQFLQSVDVVLDTALARLAIAAVGLVLLLGAVVLLVQWGRQRTRLAQIFGRSADPAFYERIDALAHAFDAQTSTEGELRAACADLEKTSHSFFDTVDIEHYDAFPGQAGKFSFSLLMLSRNGTGIMLTSLTNAQGSKVYVKRIETGKSDTALSHEEQELLNRYGRP